MLLGVNFLYTSSQSPFLPATGRRNGGTVFFVSVCQTSMLEKLARDQEESADYIRKKMDALQDEICASGEIGNRAAEKTWQRAQELLEEFLPLANSQDPR